MGPRRQAFVEHYLSCWNASEAARRAGYRGRPNTVGPRLLLVPAIQAEIQRRIDEIAMSADDVLIRLAEQARGSWAPYIDKTGNVDLAAMERDKKLHLIKKIKRTSRRVAEEAEMVTIEVEAYDAQSALVHLGRHHSLFTDNVSVDFGKMSDADLLKYIQDRAAALGGGSPGSREAGPAQVAPEPK